MKKILLFTCLIATCLAACFVRAGQAGGSAPAGKEAQQDRQGEDEWFDHVQQTTSSTLLATSRWLDDFFDDARFVEEENKSRARVKLTTIYDEDDGFDFRPRLNIRIHLPNLSEQLHLLLFASEDEKPEVQTRAGSRIVEESDDREASAALQYFLRETEKYNISFTGGLSFEYFYGGIRYRYEKEVGPWQGRFITLLRYYTDDGWENLNSLDFDREWTEKWFTRATAQLDWYEDRNELPFSLMFRLYQLLGPEKVFSYEWENHFASAKQGELTDLWLLLRYRQQFLRRWLFYEISPRVNFPRDDDWNPNYGLLFRIELIFGFTGI
ncbi:MAG: hypothetical protein RBR09_11535 [Desulfobulbaceae bacterium]|jgi:hypothetical protein|nr:hypothetical protein [Desulfobulbaceae bacterium]MDY0351877.1 hypothetical protein [Desulfobulbaceae bacterium]